jgi:hypothetical protein
MRRSTLLGRLLLAVAVLLALLLNTGTALAQPSPSQSYVMTGDGDKNYDKNNKKQQNQQQAPDPNPNCTLVVPPNPLSAAGLATPYELVATDKRNGECHEASDAQSAFVEATIIDRGTGHVTIYRPLVIDSGTRPAFPPIKPHIDGDDVVGIWFGYQGDTLTLAHAPMCVNGPRNSPFGQFAYCNADQFFAAAHAAITAGQLQVPALGTAQDGQPCPTTRDFSVVDQDQSDNVITRYVVEKNGTTRQDTGAPLAENEAFLNNGSDNALLNNFIQPALGCQPFQVPDQTAGGRMSSSLALNELQAELQPQPVALVPPADPMSLVDGKKNFTKNNLYRLGVNQQFSRIDNSKEYCQNLAGAGLNRIQLDQQFTKGQPSPDVAMAPDLLQFLVQRFQATLQNLGCPNGDPPKQDG